MHATREAGRELPIDDAQPGTSSEGEEQEGNIFLQLLDSAQDGAFNVSRNVPWRRRH